MRAAIRYLLLAALAVAVSPRPPARSWLPPPAAAPFTSPDGLWTWSRPLPFGYPANAISTAAPGELFVATTVSDLLATTDGGASWSWSRTSAVPGLAGGLNGVQFVSATEGWAWGPDTTLENEMLLHTTDGGATWQSNLTVPAEPGWLLVRFAGPLSGWVVAPDGDGSTLYHTTDSGQTWSAPLDAPSSDYNLFGTLAPQGGQRALLMETVWSTGSDNGEIVGTQMWRTTDGGATWSAPTMVRGGADIGNATFSSATKGWATGESWPSGDSWLWGTTNGGVTWHKVRRAPGVASVTTVGNDVWVVGGGALHSSDGGKTWQDAAPPVRPRPFSDPLNGWIANGATYSCTTDGGKTWQQVTPAAPPGGTAVSGLAAVAGGTVWGTTGRVIRSTDGGGHWRITTKRKVAAVAAVSARRAWAVGRKGLVIHTSDGGHHWTRQRSGVTVNLRDVFFVDARHGWASGGRHAAAHGRRRAALGPQARGDRSPLHHCSAGLRRRPARHRPHQHRLRRHSGHKRRRTHLGENAPPHLERPAQGRDRGGCFSRSDHRPCLPRWRPRTFLHQQRRRPDLATRGRSTQQRFNTSASPAPARCCVRAVGHGVATSRDDGATWSYDGAPTGGGLTSVQFVGSDTLMIGGF